MKKQRRVVAPVIAKAEHGVVPGLHDLEIAPAYFRNLLAHADDAFGPVQHRVVVPPLRGDVDMLETVGPAANDGHDRLVALCETSVWLRRPLHRRAATGSFRQREIITHA